MFLVFAQPLNLFFLKNLYLFNLNNLISIVIKREDVRYDFF